MKNKKPPIKAQIKTLFINLRKDIGKREDYYNSKSENWQNSNIGIPYNQTTLDLDSFLSDLESNCWDLKIELPYLK